MPIAFILVLFIGLLVLTSIVIIKHYKSSKTKKIAKNSIRSGKRDEAIISLQKMLTENPDDLISMYKLADLLIKSNKPAEGLQIANKLLERNLSGSGITQIKAVLLVADGNLELGKKEVAYKNLKIAYGIDSTNLDVNLHLAIYEYEAGNYEESFSYATRSIKLDLHSIDGHYYRGLSAYQKGSNEAAIESLRKVLSLKPNHFQAAFHLGVIYSKMNMVQESVANFNLALRNATLPDLQAQVYYHVGLLERKQLHFVKAIKSFENALRLTSNLDIKKDTLRECIEIFSEKKDVPKIIYHMKELLKLEPGNASIKEKLAYYGELHENSNLQNYEMYGMNEFLKFCNKLCKAIVSIDTIQDSSINKDGSVDVLASRTTKSKHIVYQFRFIRSSGDIGEMIVRDLYTKMRNTSGEKAIFVSNSGYSKGAVEFAETRVITLINKQGLIQYLSKMKD